MKIDYVVNQLKSVLPFITDYFTDSIDVTSISRIGQTVTVETSSNHLLNNNDYVYISGSKSPVKILTINRIGNIATAVTEDPHDLTEEYFTTCEIYGANQQEYNGNKKLLSVPNRKTFTFEVLGSPATPATGTIYLNDNYYYRNYNGRYQITSTGANSFTYQLPANKLPISPAQGDIKVKKNPRIARSIDIERALEAYTAQNQNKLFIFVSEDGVSPSNDRYQLDDTTYKWTTGVEYRQRIIFNFSLYVITPAIQSIAGGYEVDLMAEIRPLLFKSLLRVIFPTNFYADPTYAVAYAGDETYFYNTAYYVRVFKFQSAADIVYQDTVNPQFNVAFRDIYSKIYLENQTSADSYINLDKEPL